MRAGEIFDIDTLIDEIDRTSEQSRQRKSTFSQAQRTLKALSLAGIVQRECAVHWHRPGRDPFPLAPSEVADRWVGGPVDAQDDGTGIMARKEALRPERVQKEQAIHGTGDL